MLIPCVNGDLISLLLVLCQLAPLVFPRTGVIQPCVISLYASQTRRHTPHLIEGLMMTFISEEVAGGQVFLGLSVGMQSGLPNVPYKPPIRKHPVWAIFCCFRCCFEKVLWKAALKLWFLPPHIHPPPPFLYTLQSHPTMPAVFFYFFTFLNSTLLLRPASLKGERALNPDNP